MRKIGCVPMIALCLVLTACGKGTTHEDQTMSLRDAYHDMEGCTMEAVVTCGDENLESSFTLRCDYSPTEEIVVEVLAPETVAGVRAVITPPEMKLEYEDVCLNVGTLSSEDISPVACLPQMMSALCDGWLLEENEETWNEIACLRITVDQTGTKDGKILTTMWLRLDDGTPVRGEIAVDNEIILQAEFTSFSFYDNIENQGEATEQSDEPVPTN